MMKLISVALLCLAVGLAGGYWLAPRRTAAEGPPERHNVTSRSEAVDLDALRALPYVDGTVDPAADATGVVVFDPRTASDGLNLYSSRTRSEAQLLDMRGQVIHRWHADTGPWQHVHLFPNGDLLALVKDGGLFKIDRNSRMLWSWRGRPHHDLDVAEDGTIHVLTRKAVRRPEIHPEVDTLVDFITILSPDGELQHEISLLDLLADSPYAFLLPSVDHLSLDESGQRDERDLDVLHVNHVEVIDGSLADLDPVFAGGGWLISMKHNNTIAIVDSTGFRWIWGPTNLTLQHHPVLLPGGTILLFDNGREASRVLEVEPLTRVVTWSYERGSEFFSRSRGSVQRLPNGNTLITESDRGYVFEVTPSGEEVWRFANPDVNENGERMAIWRMTRIEEQDLTFLRR